MISELTGVNEEHICKDAANHENHKEGHCIIASLNLDHGLSKVAAREQKCRFFEQPAQLFLQFVVI